MKKEDSNLFFYPETWKKYREKGKNKFVLMPTFFTVPLVTIYFFFIEKNTKGNLASSLTLSAIAAFIIFCIRISTWLWKEYKYNRYENNAEKYTKKDVLIFILNLIRIIVILVFYIFILLYTLGFFSVDWKSFVNF